MATPLNAAQKQKINDALDLVTQILDCCDALVAAGHMAPDPDSAKLRSNLTTLHSMMYTGKIDIDTTMWDAIGWTDGDGIHFDPDHPAFPLRPDGYPIMDAWFIIQTLLHEKYHYLYHTGFGAFRKLFNIPGFIVLGLLKFFGAHDGSLAWHETQAYWHAYRMLGVLERNLFWICLKNPGCIPDCEAHKLSVADARNKQKPH